MFIIVEEEGEKELDGKTGITGPTMSAAAIPNVILTGEVGTVNCAPML